MMKDPARLLDTSASELELRLLRAGASEQPPPAAMARLTQTLGVGSSSGMAASALPPAAASKLVLGTAALGIVLAGTVWVASRPTNPPPALQQHAPVADREPTRAETAPVTNHATPTSSLALEIARIDAIRKQLAADQAQDAISALLEYQRDFPHGALRQEADVLNIEALRRAGERKRARELASRFLAQNPDSPHSARVRELLHALGSDAR